MTCTGEGGMLEDERAASTTLVYQMTPSRYMLGPRTPAHGGRHRAGGGAGGEAGDRGRTPRHEGVGAGGPDALASGGGGPALDRPPPRLPGGGRPSGEDRGAARGHRLPGTHLPQDGGDPAPLRRGDRREGGGGRDRAGRGRGRHRRLARDPAGPHRHPHRVRDPGGARGARRVRHVRRGLPGGGGRDPVGDRCGEVPCARGGRGDDRHCRADCPRVQLAALS